MVDIEPVAFLSYVRADDDHDGGRITDLRKLLEGEVKMQTGREFSVFQDRNDLIWGQQWEQRIEKALLSVTFLIPIVTPRYFQSHACKKEFETFLLREKTLGEARLILPIYYVTCDEMREGFDGPNKMASVLRCSR
jgi:cobaltochelatase CobT